MADDIDEELMESLKGHSAVKQEIMTSNTEESRPLEEYWNSRSYMRNSSEDILKSPKKEVIDALNQNDIQSLHEEVDLGITVIKEEEEGVQIAGLVDSTPADNAPEFNDDCGKTNLSPGNSGPSKSKIKLELFEERVDAVQQNADLPRNHQLLVNKRITESTQSTSTSMLPEASEQDNSTLKLNTCKCNYGDSDCICSKDYDTRETLNTISINGLESQRIEKKYKRKTRKHHTKKSTQTSRKTYSTKKSHACNICNLKFTHKGYLTIHQRIHTGEKPYACPDCSYKCSQKSSLIRHLRTHTGEKPYPCNICYSKFTEKSKLIVHQRTHTGEKPYACPDCSFKFSQKQTLTQHLRTHTGEKPYACPDCSLKFSKKHNLTKHLRTHTGEKPYACPDCSLKFSHKHNLIKHLRTHTGEKPYACPDCPFKFSQKKNLTKHLRTHTGEKPYACPDCSFKCSHKSTLKGHIKTHTRCEKPYACDHCPYKCPNKTYLIQHLKTHTGEKPYTSNNFSMFTDTSF